MRKLAVMMLLALTVSFVAACGGGETATVAPEPSDTPVAGALPTQADSPTTVAPAVQTAEAAATQVALDQVATQAARETQSVADSAATETVLSPIRADLAAYGLDPQVGELGWIHPPQLIEIEGYLQSDYENRFLATVSENMVVSTDLTWNTFTGLAGCGFMIHANGDEENGQDGYLLIASRGGNGRILLMTLVDGEVEEVAEFNYRTGLRWRNDETNRVAFVVRDNVFTAFANGENVGEIAAPADYQFERGFTAMVAVSESGATQCQFDNTWLWQLP